VSRSAHRPTLRGVETLFEMALQAHAVGFGDEQFVVIRAVWPMAGHAVFARHSFVFVDEGAFHFHMTFQADAVHAVPGGLVKIRVGIVTILAVELSLQYTMTEGKPEFGDLGRMTLQAKFAFVPEIGNRCDTTGEMHLVGMAIGTGDVGARMGAAGPFQSLVRMALGAHGNLDALVLARQDLGADDEAVTLFLHVEAAGSVAYFTAGDPGAGDGKSAVGGVGGVGVEFADIVMAVEAGLGSDIVGTIGNIERIDEGNAACRDTRAQQENSRNG